MSYKNTGFRFIAQSILVFFLTNTLSPTLQFAFADSTQYYVDATGGSDANDGLTPATAWQTIAQVNATPLLQGDTVSLLCGDTWNETLTINTINGGPGLPVTVNGYGAGCTSSNPSLDGIDILSSSEIIVDGISITNPSIGSAISVNLSNNITLSNNILSNGSGICMNISNSTLVGINTNSFSSCDYGINIDTSQATVENNTLSTIEQDGITVTSGLAVSLSQNILTNIAQNGIMYGQDTSVTQNTITNSCSTASANCSAIRNDPTLSGVTLTSFISENTISGVGSGISGDRNSGILIDNVDGVDVSFNSIINAERAIFIKNANNLNIANNTLLNSRMQTVSAIQTLVGRTHTNTFSNNTILQKNPDYSHIEMRDEVSGSDLADTFLTAASNTIYPNYKPNITSYVRSVNFGGTTQEYTKDILEQFDPTVVKFQYFAYKPYTNTGSYATANLLLNPNFDSDTTGWSVAADIGLSPTLTHNVSGNYIGGSATIIPAGGSPDRIWVTNDALLNITSGETYLITGYTKSSTGNINLRAFLHETGNRSNIYSDRIAEAYASSTGGVFSMYLTTTATAADGNLTIETSNPNIDYEIDSISIRRMNAVIKNTTANEILIFSNSGGVIYSQPCPGGVPCFAYVDGLNAATSWPIAIDPYRTNFVLWNGSPNILNTPVCSLNISAGSVPTGLPVDVDWTVTNSLSQILNYETYTGSTSVSVASTGMVTFIPPYDNITTISLDTINDVGPRQCSIQVTTTNTAPYINPTTTTGSEDVPQINGTLSGVDLNPGDSIFFEQFGSNVTNGTLNVDLSGSFQYFPNPNFCGNDTFQFRAYDQLGHYADEELQTVSVACINDIPVVNNDTGTGIAGAPLLINVIANDTDADSPYQAQTLTITGYTNPLNGTLTVIGNQFEYTPNLVFSGTEVFDYSISDQDGALSNTGTVTVNVTFANIQPVAQSEIYILNEDSTLADTLTGSDANNDIITFAPTLLPTNGTLNLLSDGTFTYTPNANYFGSDSFTFIVNDGVVDSSGAIVTITVDPVLDAPVTNNDNYSLSQDTVLSVPVMNNDTDVDSVVLNILGYTNPLNGNVVVSGTGFTYTPNALYIGPDSFTYSIIDSDGLISNTGSVTLNVTVTNNPPVANADSYNLNEDSQYTGTLSGTDIELSTLTYNILSLPANGTLVSTNTGAFTYTPDADYSGTDSFTFEVSDGVNTSNTATITLNVSGINDTPVSLSGSFTATGNSMSNSGNILLGSVTGTDIDSVGLTFSASTLPAYGSLTLLSDGTFSYTPALAYVGSDSFVFTVSDGFLVSTGSTVSLTVINAAIPAPTVSMSASPSAVYSSGTTNMVWSSTNATSCITPWGSTATGGSYTTPELISSTTYSINCTGLGGTTPRNVTISILPPPSSPSSTVGIGGGGSPGSYAPAVYYNIVNSKDAVINSGTNTDDSIINDDIELDSAPSTDSQPVFVMDDPTGLLGQLFLTNRYLIDPYAPYNNLDNNTDNQYTDGTSEVIENEEMQSQDRVPQAFDILDSVELDENQGPILLRYLARMFIAESNISSDPMSNYDYGIELMNSFDFAEYSRLAFTREYIIRIFEQQKRRYEEMIYRSVSTTYDNTYNSANEEADFNTDTDPGLIEEEYNTYEDESADLDSLLAQLGQDEF